MEATREVLEAFVNDPDEVYDFLRWCETWGEPLEGHDVAATILAYRVHIGARRGDAPCGRCSLGWSRCCCKLNDFDRAYNT